MDTREKILENIFNVEVNAGVKPLRGSRFGKCIEVTWLWWIGKSEGDYYRYPALTKLVKWGEESWYALDLLDKLLEGQINYITRQRRVGRFRGEKRGWFRDTTAALDVNCKAIRESGIRLAQDLRTFELLQLNVTHHL